MKILIADSAGDAKSELGVMLSREGYECVFVDNSRDVIDRVYSELPDVIILDMKSVKPDSLDILRELKSAPSTRDIPVITIASEERLKLVKAYELGAYDYISRPFFREEILARIGNITYASERIKELEKLLDRDYLTGVYNRRFFMERFVEEIAWSTRYSEPLSVMMLDIDYFKVINDTYGHGCGDKILKQITDTLSLVLRTEDMIARYGGEEFIILLPSTGTEGALRAGEKLRRAVEEREFYCEDKQVKLSVTVSIGVTSRDGITELSPDKLIGQADEALYVAKESGRNKVVEYGW